ncbi:MAG: hypothetical protein HC812_06220 [Leptolyngbya sp. RL_3_1]|nr:hypothetical protein [Leptolyngbya sp. RL_3_1]
MKATAIALLGLLGLSGCGLFERSGVPAPGETTAVSELPPKQLYDFQPIQGTRYLMAPINRSDDRASGFSSYDSGYTSHNVVFLDAVTLTTQRLFNTNDFLIVSTTEYGETIDGTFVTQWLVYLVITADTNDDGELDYRDHITLATTNTAGEGYTEVIVGIEQTFGIILVGPGSLVVAYEQAGVKTVSKVNLAEQTVVNTQPLVDLGAEVK